MTVKLKESLCGWKEKENLSGFDNSQRSIGKIKMFQSVLS